MKIIESIRYNRTGEINDAVLYDGPDQMTAVILATQAIAAQSVETRRNLFTTTAIRIEF